MSEKYTPTTDEIKRCWGLKVDVHKRPEREAEFERWLAKIKADAVREYAKTIPRMGDHVLALQYADKIEEGAG